MPLGLVQRLLDREISSTLSWRQTYRNLYGDRQLIKELDIVDELQGHTGCVNALCWSKSGRLLASGSDDQHINLYAYQPDNGSSKQFQLHTTVATGHSQNIFSVKFAPHSNDRTIISCAGDSEVRVFDLEYAGISIDASRASVRATAGRTARQDNIYRGVKYLSDGNTNCRVYRSHADRAKRIVVEDSPHLFLTCGEEGDVRQWDLRQPSSFYPRPKDPYFGEGSDHVPPPLISYRRYNIDLNTISCSASQPHYIALGGAHINCFLHDRRMIGRDRLHESGRPGQQPRSQFSEDAMDRATRCVRRFAPTREQAAQPGSRGHITACKISDARPDEMIVSWSNDHIYSFDLIRGAEEPSHSSRLKNKRKVRDSESLQSKQGTTTLRVSYGNGQQEDISVQDDALSSEQVEARKLLKAILSVRQDFFQRSEQTLTARFTSTLSKCAVLLPDIDIQLREWTYPMDPSPYQVRRQQMLRGVRESIRRCIQAVGTISRVLGGQLRTASRISPLVDQFIVIDNRATDLTMTDHERFIFDFSKAICAWLDSGIGRLIEVFICPRNVARQSRLRQRLPIPEAEASVECLGVYLKGYLELIAPIKPILDPESNRFATDEIRRLWASPTEAVLAFIEAAEQPFADLTSDATGGPQRSEALEYWCLRVARGLMMQAFQKIDWTLVEEAFGGRMTISQNELSKIAALEDIDAEDSEDEAVSLTQAATPSDNGSAPSDSDTNAATTNDINMDIDNDDDNHGEEEEEQNEYDMDDYDPEDDSSEPDEEDGVPNLGRPRYMYQSTADRERERNRDTVNANVPFGLPTMSFSGAANTQTVKDCNYFGLEDEYVVAGSDDGNFFLWDRKSGELVNILQGDTDVVNVVQGHPYEPMLAVSGIDKTIKIFSPDNRAREGARLGIGLSSTSRSSTSWPHRSRRSDSEQEARRSSHDTTTDAEADDYIAPTGLRSRQRFNDRVQIMENNTNATRRGNDDVVITRSMLMHLAQRMREQRAANGGDPNVPLEGLETLVDEDGRVQVVVGEDCNVM